MLVAPAPGVVDFAALSCRNARIDHGAALRAKAHRRLRAAVIEIITGIGCHFYLLKYKFLGHTPGVKDFMAQSALKE
jgi:hypothetical protein